MVAGYPHQCSRGSPPVHHPRPERAGVIARTHTEAYDGGGRLRGQLITADTAELQTSMPPGLTFDPVLMDRFD